MDERTYDIRHRDEKNIVHSLLSPADIEAILYLVSTLTEPMKIAEIGCYEGGTTLFIVSALTGKKFRIYAVDKWSSPQVYKKFLTTYKDADMVVSIRLTSSMAMSLFEDGELDMVFIDADHHYTSVVEDIKGWIPKVKKGGILVGHDADGYYTKYSDAERLEIDNNLVKDKTSFNCHAGVVAALYNVFKDDYEIYPKSRVWYKIM